MKNGSALLPEFLAIVRGWLPAFSQTRSGERAIQQALACLLSLGRRTVSRSLFALGRQHRDWSADYRLHSRSQWNVPDLFQPILEHAAALCQESRVVIAMDDTRLRKTGRKILSAFYQRDPQSPKFRFNLMWGLRFLHFSLLVPLYRSQPDTPPRSLPVRFHEVPALKKPGRKASPEQVEAYKNAIRIHNLSTETVSQLAQLRQSLDAAGMKTRSLLAVGDGGFCNRTLFRKCLERVDLLVRTRRDCRLSKAAEPGQRRFYAAESFTPDSVRLDESLPWQHTRIFHGGQWRQVRSREVSGVYWRSGAARRPLRLFVVAPIPYSSGKGKRKYYGEPAFLLTTDLKSPASDLLQAYFDRWQIEVSHREMKDTLGIGQAQVRNVRSVPRQPAMMVAAYSALLLAGIKTFGDIRSGAFPELPRWRRNAKRPSCLDLITVLRQEALAAPQTLPALAQLDSSKLISGAAA